MVSVAVSGEDTAAAASDLDVNANTGLITVNRNLIITAATNPTTYVLTVNVDDHPSDANKRTSENVDITVEVMNENNKPVITGKSASTLNIDENSIGGTAVVGGAVQCFDKEVDIPCDGVKDQACSDLATSKDACDGINECEWKIGTSKCGCRRQQLEFFALLNNPLSTTFQGDPLPIIFTFKSGSESDTTVYYPPLNQAAGEQVQATLYLDVASAGLLDFGKIFVFIFWQGVFSSYINTRSFFFFWPRFFFLLLCKFFLQNRTKLLVSCCFSKIVIA